MKPTHGGKRPGAGRPNGEPTKQVRVYAKDAKTLAKRAKTTKATVAGVVRDLLQ